MIIQQFQVVPSNDSKIEDPRKKKVNDDISIGSDDDDNDDDVNDDDKMSTGTSNLAKCCSESNIPKAKVKSQTVNNECKNEEYHQKPLIQFLCNRYNCSIQELQVHFMNVEMRKKILKLLRAHEIKTTHLRARARNPRVRCDDFSCQNANFVPAFNGYLGITVRQYYYARHGIRLRYPYLPCLIEHGGGAHRSFYPLEMLAINVE